MKLLGAHKAYGATTVLHVDSLLFERTKVYAVIGSNGSGKTTLLRVLAGQIALDKGEVFVDPGERIGYMPQKSYAFYGSVEKNVRLGASLKASQGQETPAGPTDADIWTLPVERRAQALLETLSIDALAKSNAKRLSGGETARMALVRLLMGDYTFLLLDEPTAALDVTSTLVAENLVRSYCAAHGAGLVIVTHSVKQAERISDEVLFMHNGFVAEQGKTSEILANPRTGELRRFLEVAGA